MQAVPPRHDETGALAALAALDVLDSPAEAQFDALVQVASLVCGVPVSLISLIDSERQWFKANIGLSGVVQTPRDTAFCAYAVLGDELMEVPDATQDARFVDNPFVLGPPGIRFYAGAPVRLSSGHTVGTLCVIDRQPRVLSDHQRQVLRALASAAGAALEGRAALQRLGRAAQAEVQAAQALTTAQAQLAALSELSPMGVYHADADGHCVYANAQMRAVFGIPRDAPLPQGTCWSAMVVPEDAERVQQQLLHSRATCSQLDLNCTVRRGDGHLREVRVLARPIIDSMGRWAGMVGSVEDVTELHREQQALADAHERMTLATDSGGIGVWSLDLASSAVHWDDWMCRLFGHPLGRHQQRYSSWAEQLHPADRAAAEQAVALAAAGGPPLDTEFRIIRLDGEVRHLRATGRMHADAQGRPMGMVGVNWDVTHMRRMAAQLAEQHELMRVTLRSIGDAVITTDARGRVVWLNPVAEQLTGWVSSVAEGLPLAEVFHILNEHTREVAENPVMRCLSEGKVVGLANHTVLVSRHGPEYGIEDSAAPILTDAGDLVGAVLVFHDVSEQRRLSGEMTYRATHDALTGLVNRGEFEARLQRLLAAAKADASTHALLYIDLDQFKLVNDACGHAVGDQLLLQVGKLLAASVRTRDTLARLGGDEFGIILENCSLERAQRVAQKLCKGMDDFRFEHSSRRFRIGVSIGLVLVDQRWDGTAAIQQAADTACYAAKEAGRNRVHAWLDSDEAMRHRQHEMQWTSRIERALDDNRFELFAQRVVPLQDGAHGERAEVLLRMRDEDGGLVLPGSFLPAAERFNLVTRIDRWVLPQALAWMQQQRGGQDLELEQLSVNLSGQSVGDRAFHAWALQQLEAANPLVRQRLCLEITETAAVTNLADAARFIGQVRELGVSVALDDFGAGASSFGYLKSLPVDCIKIDGRFIRDLDSDPLDEVAVRCFVEVAKVMGLRTVAEFVDSASVCERLRDIGIDYAQGYLVHRPAPIDELSRATWSNTIPAAVL